MGKKQIKLQSLIKETKFRTTYQISLYINQFISISLAKQGNYYVAGMLSAKSNSVKQQSMSNQNTMFRTNSSRVFKIQYNNHTEILNSLICFKFVLEQPIKFNSQKQNNKVSLIFQLHRCKNQKSLQPERKLEQQYECVSQFSFQINTKEGLSFIEYFSFGFQQPYASQLNGVIVCLMTNFQGVDHTNLLQLQSQLIQSKQIGKSQGYHDFNVHLKKMTKKYIFSSFSIQKLLSQAILGYKKFISIPEKELLIQSQEELIRKSIVIEEKDLNFDKFQHKQKIGHQQYQLNQCTSSLNEPSSISKFQINNQKQCTEQQFIKHLTFMEYEQKNTARIIEQIKNVGLKNMNILKQIAKCIKCQAKLIGISIKRINLDQIQSQYERKKFSLYNQKISYFGKSLLSANQQMKSYIKSISNLKSRQKESQNFFTKMNQVFNLIPDCLRQNQTIKFDKCPFIFHSYENLQQGVTKQDLSEVEIKIQNQSNQKTSSTFQKQQFRNIFILAHGYQASCINMQKLKIQLKKIFVKSKFLLLKSYSNQMDRSLDDMGQKAAKQIQAYINEIKQNSSKTLRIIMIGHSMGGIILRSSLQHLDTKIKSLLHTYISFASPHLGYLHCKSFITGTGIKLIQSVHPSLSLKQLSNKDHINIKQTFIYKLSNVGSLKDFENVVVFSSIEDKYVPWNSARIQLYKKAQGIGGKSTTGGWLMNSQKQYIRYVEQQMINHILGIGQKNFSKVKNIYRFQVDFNINQVNLDSMIGRTSHVAFLTNQHLLSIVFQICLEKSLYSQLKYN